MCYAINVVEKFIDTAARSQSLSPVPLKVFKDEITQTFQAAVVGVTIVGFGEISYKRFQIRIGGDHKGSDWNF
jgi:hypothetical protein